VKNRLIAIPRRWGAAALFVALPLVSAGALLSSCEDAPPPEYPTPDTLLRLIPEESAIDEDGGAVFVLVELQRSDESDTTKPILIYVRAKGATSEKLPGPVFCAAKESGAPETPDGGVPEAGDGGAPEAGDGGITEGGAPEGGMPDGGTPDAGAPAVEADLTIPDIALLPIDGHNARTTGFVVTIPKGTAPVELVATAYSHDGPASSCDAINAQIVAIGAARIERRKPDAGISVADASTPMEAGAPEDGGGGSTSSSTTSSSSGGTGSGGTGGGGGGMMDGGTGDSGVGADGG
jgi:hypothetical protein